MTSDATLATPYLTAPKQANLLAALHIARERQRLELST
jgi:hypothetical protein